MSSDTSEWTQILAKLGDFSLESIQDRLVWLKDHVEVSVESDAAFQWLCSYRTLGILSSHPSRNAFRSPLWQQALHSILEHAKRTPTVVLYPLSAPYSESIAFACSRLGLPSMAVATQWPSTSRPSFQQTGDCLRLLLDSTGQIARSKLPADDLAVAFLAETIAALEVTPGGKIATILERVLECSSKYPGRVWIGAKSQPSRPLAAAQKKWSHAGAILWFPKPAKPSVMSSWACQHRVTPATLQIHSAIPQALAVSQEYLVHTTRARQLLWPDQSDLDALDEAFRLASNPNPTPLETLLRIITDQRLLATSACKRAGVASISFTANPISTLLQMRAFQSHRARWDWEPYGMAIKKSTLEQLGAKPVRYLSRKQIEVLDPSEQAFCQPKPETTTDRDWTIEKEWRLPKDIRLSYLPSNDAFLFVARDAEAQSLSHYSRWPVYSLERLSLLRG